MSWLTGSLIGLPRYVWIIALIVAAFIVIRIVDNRDSALIETAEQSGAIKAITRGQETTLKQIGHANEASKKIDSAGDPLKYDTCLRDSAPGYEGNCERYKPNEPLPD